MPDLIGDLRAAIMLLTRIPVGSAMLRPRAVWAFPITGALIGLLGGVLIVLGQRWHMPQLLGATLAVTAQIIATGALHEDGLADTIDGFGGGRTRERRLEIMRDSRIGSYGALALILATAIRITAFAALAHPIAMAVSAAALSRGAIVLLAARLPPARPDGLGAMLGRPAFGPTAAGLLIAILPCLLWHVGFAAILATLVGTSLLGILARRKIGGSTGDIFGAGAVIADSIALIVFSTSRG